MTEWRISDTFDGDYLEFYAPLLTDERADDDVTTICSLLDLVPDTAVLDLACGHGRIANRLAQRGARVTGLDATAMFLDIARADAERSGLEIDYVLGDMRQLPWVERFDVVISWFTSYGYFDDDQNRLVLDQVRRCLRPGGRLMLELNHRDGLLPMWRTSDVVHGPNGMMIDEREFDPITGRGNTVRTVVRDGAVRRFRFFTRLFSFTELRSWLLDVGFTKVVAYARDGTPLTRTATRMVVVATL
jgi:SAM-dependent methyltransferase